MMKLRLSFPTNHSWSWSFSLQLYMDLLSTTSLLLWNKGSRFKFKTWMADRDFNIFRKLHSIRTLQINLMDLKQHFIFCNLFIYRLFLDQGLNKFIQTYYKELGPENAFDIWWTFFYIEHVGEEKKIISWHQWNNYFRIKVHIQHEGLFQCQESAAGVQWFAGQEVPWPGVTPGALHHPLETSAASRVLRGVEQNWLQEKTQTSHHLCHSVRWLVSLK